MEIASFHIKCSARLLQNKSQRTKSTKQFRRLLQDVRVKRGANVASGHHLVVASLKLKLKKKWMETESKKRKYNVNLLKDTQTRENYKQNYWQQIPRAARTV